MDDILSSIKEFFKNRALVRKILSLALSATGVIMLVFLSIARLPIDNGRGRPLDLNLWALLFNFRDLRSFLHGEIFLFFFVCTVVELLVSGALILLNVKAFLDDSESIVLHGITVAGAILCAVLYIVQTIVFNAFFHETGMPPEMNLPSSSFLALIYALLFSGLLFYFALPKCSKCGSIQWKEFTSLNDNLVCPDCQKNIEQTTEDSTQADENNVSNF
ncbi:MAG: hypothetical protein IJF39_05205 [Clostridia bacterium]|nr:hypothetical protein [Clostridia bacterium]